ncbi:hypothetical protein [Pseudonocardia sp. GCM10023141]|uniref:hypothetical protein n=1 Tax=Pseudonocardia sp. GCM10023141 TaxID=3252653 RepID=UPI003606265A
MLVIIAPDAAVSFIIAAGALLAVLGAFLNAAAQRARQSITDNRMAAPASSSAEATLDVPTVVLAPIEGAPQQRVA